MALIQRSLPWMWWRRRTQDSAGSGPLPAADPLFEAGLRLREHREQRGLSLRDLSREVRITTPVLEALSGAGPIASQSRLIWWPCFSGWSNTSILSLKV